MVNDEIKNYVENIILPQYLQNERAHGLEHINSVIKRSLKFAQKIDNIDINMVYVIAAYHDISHHINKDKHGELSAEYFMNDSNITKFFNDQQQKLIKEAIEDHRSSITYEPRSIYGKIVATADRTFNIDESLRRTHYYSLKYFSEMSLDEMIDRSYNLLNNLYGNGSETKAYFEDEEYEEIKEEMHQLLSNKEMFKKRYLQAIKNIVNKQYYDVTVNIKDLSKKKSS